MVVVSEERTSVPEKRKKAQIVTAGAGFEMRLRDAPYTASDVD